MTTTVTFDTPDLTNPAAGPTIYVDADGCPVRAETVKVAARHGLPVVFVANAWLQPPRGARVRVQVVAGAFDAADDWIAERAKPGDIVVTADVPLASRCVKAGATVIAPNGKAFDDDSIGLSLATRNLLHELRGAGAVTGGPKPFEPRDRSRFLSALDQAIVRRKRAGGAS